jgi:hypothetical protein
MSDTVKQANKNKHRYVSKCDTCAVEILPRRSKRKATQVWNQREPE